MTEVDTTPEITRQVKSQLDSMVVGIELTLISIIQGIALGGLATSAVPPLINWQMEYWPYIVLGLLAILIFWSRSLIHTLSFIAWPLEFGHNFIYFVSTLVEVALFTQLTTPENWFALSVVYFGFALLLYWYDLRMVYRHGADFQTPAERKLLQDIIGDQRINVRLWMPASIAFHLVSWWLIHTYPDQFVEQRWHVGLALMAVAIGAYYLWEGVHILRRRQHWIVARYVEERRESLDPGEETA